VLIFLVEIFWWTTGIKVSIFRLRLRCLDALAANKCLKHTLAHIAKENIVNALTNTDKHETCHC
jgi:hypothetical protein